MNEVSQTDCGQALKDLYPELYQEFANWVGAERFVLDEFTPAYLLIVGNIDPLRIFVEGGDNHYLMQLADFVRLTPSSLWDFEPEIKKFDIEGSALKKSRRS